MEKLWKRLERWLSAHAPSILKTLRKGATPNQIAEAEKVLQEELPKEYIEFYSIHDGQKHPADVVSSSGGLFYGALFLPLKTMLSQWSVLKELRDEGRLQGTSKPDGSIKTDWWHPGWIPLVTDPFGHHPACLDLAPTKEADRGQIISWWNDDPERELLDNSLRDWFGNYIEELEEGVLVYDPEYGIVDAEHVPTPRPTPKVERPAPAPQPAKPAKRLPAEIVTALQKQDFDKLRKRLNKSNINLLDEDGSSLLVLALTHDYEWVVQFLVDQGIDINFAETGEHWTALHHAAHFLRVYPVRVLLEAGADVNAQDLAGMTPLHHVAMAADPRVTIAHLLLEHGADPSLKDNGGHSAMEWQPELFKGAPRPKRRSKK